MDQRTLPAVPPMEVVDTGDPERVSTITESFFREVLGYYGYANDQRLIFTEIASYNCATGGLFERDFRLSDENLTVLKIRDIAVASVFRGRSTFNDIAVHCALYALTEEHAKRVTWSES